MAYDALQIAYDNLEVQIAERTRQLNERIEEYKRTQDALEESEMKFRAFAETATDWYWETDKDHHLSWMSHGLREVLGLQSSNAIGKARWELTDEDIENEKWRAHRAVLAAHEPFRDFEYRRVRGNGQVGWYSVSGDPSYDRSGAFVGYRGSGRDITQRVAAQHALEESNRRMLVARNFSDAIISTTAEAIITVDEQGGIETFNPAAESIFGYTQAEVIGQNVSMLMPQGVRERHKQYTQSSAKFIDAINRVERDLIGQRKNGERFPLSINLATMTARDETTKYVGIVRDVTQRKQWEDQIRNAKEQAENANRAKSEFLSSMSHELRTPLNAILGFAQLLQDSEAPLDDEQIDFVTQIINGGDYLLELIGEVLDLAKIEAGGFELTSSAVDGAALLSECVDVGTVLAVDKGITLIQEVDKDQMPPMVGDATRLKQVLLNLVSNAIKYNRPSGTVTLSGETVSDSHYRLTVTDTGFGIAPEQQGGVFQAFNRLGAERSDEPGTGLGLAISRQLMDRMDGAIGFKSTPGKGSSFWVDVPLATAISETTTPSRKAANATPELSVPAGVKKSANILCIEDNIANANLVRHMVRHYFDTTVVTASTAKEGLSIAQNQIPDVVLMDIDLPDMNGFDAAAEMRRNPDLQHVPVIAISANASSEAIERGRQMGFASYLTKPVRLEEFVPALSEVLLER